MEAKKAKRKMILKRIVLILAGALLLYALAMTFVPVAVLSATVNRHYSYQNSGEESEGIYCESIDGERLWMKICPVEEPKGTVIFISGLSGPAVTAFQAHADWMNSLGYAAVLLELRGHGLSGGDQIGLGFTETEDVRAVLQELQKDPSLKEAPVILFGVSMGAVTALNALGEIPEIAGAVALSPYASYEEQFEMRMENAFVPPLSRRYVRFLVSEFLDMTYGEEITERVNPRSEILKAAGRPVFLIAAKGDRRVPSENTLILKELYPEASLWLREGSAHLVVKGNNLKNVSSDTEYRLKIEEWLEKNIR